MNAETKPNLANSDKTETELTLPPTSALRFSSPADLFKGMPALAEMMQASPNDGEDALAFMTRLRATPTPEQAVTYTAFAAKQKMAVWWGYECLRSMPETLSKADRELLELVADWTTNTTTENRFRVMKAALWAEMMSPSVLLSLAVGWSGGPIAPNDPAPVSPNRCPRAINSAILSCLAKTELSERSKNLDKVIELAESLFRVY